MFCCPASKLLENGATEKGAGLRALSLCEGSQVVKLRLNLRGLAQSSGVPQSCSQRQEGAHRHQLGIYGLWVILNKDTKPLFKPA
jgi:hypothetical protein